MAISTRGYVDGGTIGQERGADLGRSGVAGSSGVRRGWSRRAFSRQGARETLFSPPPPPPGGQTTQTPRTGAALSPPVAVWPPCSCLGSTPDRDKSKTPEIRSQGGPLFRRPKLTLVWGRPQTEQVTSGRREAHFGAYPHGDIQTLLDTAASLWYNGWQIRRSGPAFWAATTENSNDETARRQTPPTSRPRCRYGFGRRHSPKQRLPYLP